MSLGEKQKGPGRRSLDSSAAWGVLAGCSPHRRLRAVGVPLGVVMFAATNCTPPDRGIVVDGSFAGASSDGLSGSSAGGDGAGGSGGPSSGGTEMGGASGGGPSSGGGSPGGGATSGGASSGGASGGSSGGASGGASTGGQTGCQGSEQCDASAPICDDSAHECRVCSVDDECALLDATRSICADDGSCVECSESSQCAPEIPVCDSGECRLCEAHSECESGACGLDGLCVPTAQVVYALAQTGISAVDCGTIAEPCLFLETAAGQLTATRNFLVLVPTSSSFTFSSQMLLPAGVDVTIIGNAVQITDASSPLVRVNGGEVRLFDLNLQGGDDKAQTLVQAVDAKVWVEGSAFRAAGVGVDAVDTELHVVSSFFDLPDVTTGTGTTGVSSGCSLDCSGVLPSVIERSRFEHMSTAVYLGSPGSSFTNNLVLGVATANYNRGVMLYAEDTSATFNTVVDSGNCAYTGLFNCSGSSSTAVLMGNITFGSTTLGGGPCYNQVYQSCPNPSYSVVEVTFPGVGNVAGDPGFVDVMAGDFRLTGNSPAVDLVPLGMAPSVDFDGNVRPGGGSPDAGAFERQ